MGLKKEIKLSWVSLTKNPLLSSSMLLIIHFEVVRFIILSLRKNKPAARNCAACFHLNGGVLEVRCNIRKRPHV